MKRESNDEREHRVEGAQEVASIYALWIAAVPHSKLSSQFHETNTASCSCGNIVHTSRRRCKKLSWRMARSKLDIRALAKNINRRRLEHNRMYPDRPIAVTPGMSRILENDETYVPYRARASGRVRPPVRNPTVGTLIEIAHALGTTVGDLLGENQYQLTVIERRRVRELLRYLSDVLKLDAPDADPRKSRR